MSRNNETSGVELVVVGVFAFCLAVVAWLMKTFDVEWQTALETAPGLIVWLLVVGRGSFRDQNGNRSCSLGCSTGDCPSDSGIQTNP